MKLFLKTILIITFFMNSVFAETFMMALKRAYDTNPELNAERENLNISKQELNISKGAYLPTVTLSGTKSRDDTDKLTKRKEIMILIIATSNAPAISNFINVGIKSGGAEIKPLN